MTYLEDAAAILHQEWTYWNQRAIKNPDTMRGEILDARLRIAEGFAKLAAVESTGTAEADGSPAEPGTRITEALSYAKGGIPDGDHHKMWVIDQMVRALTGCPMVTRTATDAHGGEYTYPAQGESAEYLRFVCEAGSWDEGIAP